MKKLLLLLLICLLPCLALAEDASWVSVPEVIRPGKAMRLSFTAPEGTAFAGWLIETEAAQAEAAALAAAAQAEAERKAKEKASLKERCSILTFCQLPVQEQKHRILETLSKRTHLFILKRKPVCSSRTERTQHTTKYLTQCGLALVIPKKHHFQAQIRQYIFLTLQMVDTRCSKQAKKQAHAQKLLIQMELFLMKRAQTNSMT